MPLNSQLNDNFTIVFAIILVLFFLKHFKFDWATRTQFHHYYSRTKHMDEGDH